MQSTSKSNESKEKSPQKIVRMRVKKINRRSTSTSDSWEVFETQLNGKDNRVIPRLVKPKRQFQRDRRDYIAKVKFTFRKNYISAKIKSIIVKKLVKSAKPIFLDKIKEFAKAFKQKSEGIAEGNGLLFSFKNNNEKQLSPCHKQTKVINTFRLNRSLQIKDFIKKYGKRRQSSVINNRRQKDERRSKQSYMSKPPNIYLKDVIN